MLAKAGISRNDFNAMKAEAAATGTTSGGGGSYSPKGNTDDDGSNTPTDQGLFGNIGAALNAKPVSGVGNNMSKTVTMTSGQYYNNKEQQKANNKNKKNITIKKEKIGG
jgi:hypothetical protein